MSSALVLEGARTPTRGERAFDFAVLQRPRPGAVDAAPLLADRSAARVDLSKAPRAGRKARAEHDVRQQLANWAGADLTRINGLGLDSVTKILSEIRTDLSRFAVTVRESPFCQGLPRSMCAVSIPLSVSHFSTAWLTNSGPLSERRYTGAPCTLIRRPRITSRVRRSIRLCS